MNKKEKLFVIAASVGAITFTISKIIPVFPLIDLRVLLIIFSLLVCFIITVKSLEYIITNLIKRRSKYKSNIYYLIAIAISISTIIIFIINIMKLMRPLPAKRAICQTNIISLSKSMLTYINDNEELFPDTNNWCDLLIIFNDARPQEFICPGSDAEIGESSYAMNMNLKVKKLIYTEPNTVILFETIYGRDPNGRNVTVSTRYSYKVLKEKGEDVSFFGKRAEKRKVYKKRWNQTGGPEMLTAENHKGEGANILFADGYVRYILKEDFNNLNWGIETNIE